MSWRSMMSQTERKIAFIASSTLLLSTLEYLIPKPLPFLRLGLANIPLLLILDSVSLGAYSVVLLLKAIGQGMISGTLFSYLFFISLAGTLASGYAMKGVKVLLKHHVSLVGCSLVGAFVSNLAQLQVASWVAYGPAIWVAAPLMLSLGLFSSLILGLLAQRYQHKGLIPKALSEGTLILELPVIEQQKHHLLMAVATLLCIVAILFAQSLTSLVLITLCMYLMQLCARRKIRILPPLMLIISLVLLSLFEPNGRVLHSFGSVAFTQGSLELALTKALRLISLLSASQSLVASNPKLKGRAGSLLMLSLSYFALISRSFKATEGSVIQRVDQALLKAAQKKDSPVEAFKRKPMKRNLFLFFAVIVYIISIYSYLYTK